MSGRRLLDVLAVIGSSRSIAAKHFAIRAEQVDRYSKTSSLSINIKSRLRNFNSNDRSAALLGNSSASQKTASGDGNPPSTQIPNPKSVQSRDDPAFGQREDDGLGQDHFYERSGKNASIDSPPKDDLPIRQKKSSKYPLPDGTIPPQIAKSASSQSQYDQSGISPNIDRTGDLMEAMDVSEPGNTSPTAFSQSSNFQTPGDRQSTWSFEARKAQRQSEEQIPSEQAEPPSGEAVEVGTQSDLNVDQERDLFYRPSMESSPVLSALPRVKLPKKAGDVQGRNSGFSNDVNSDTFYSSLESSTEPRHDHEMQSERQQNGISEDMMQNLFHSKKVASVFSNQSKAPSHEEKDRNRSYIKYSVPSREISLQDSKRQNSGPDPLKAPDQGVFVKAPWADSATAESASSDAHLANAIAMTSQLSQPKPDETELKAPSHMRESKVPSSRVGRLWQYAGLASSMTFGAVGESLKRATGGSGHEQGSFMLSAANMERLVSKLSKMRGAALKLGQMMSFQDSKLLPAPIHEVLQRVQDSADYMPSSQRDTVLVANLGKNWRELFETFDEKPFAAASIGQVHGAVLKSNKKRVVVKVQYPGVATSIDSDLNNLSILLTASRLLPKGLYLEKTIANARTELAWECDYLREADCGRKFRSLLADEHQTFVVPEMINEASGKEVLTMERMEGVAVTKLPNPTQQERDWIGAQILRLCLREILDFHYMQTDPNWTNFLLNRATGKLELLDFGASRGYPDNFIALYARNLQAASRGDRSLCKDLSVQLGYLTGYESKAMTDAHIDSVMTLAEPFSISAPEIYDFKEQTITDRVKALIPVMLRERLSAPPEETYSLHRKLSGAFLLCARLGSRIRCREMFEGAMGYARLS